MTTKDALLRSREQRLTPRHSPPIPTWQPSALSDTVVRPLVVNLLAPGNCKRGSTGLGITPGTGWDMVTGALPYAGPPSFWSQPPLLWPHCMWSSGGSLTSRHGSDTASKLVLPRQFSLHTSTTRMLSEPENGKVCLCRGRGRGRHELWLCITETPFRKSPRCCPRNGCNLCPSTQCPTGATGGRG